MPTRLGLVAAAAIWIALLGPAWNHVPATPDAPATSLNFADLIALNTTNPDGLQSAFYSWLAWVFAVGTTAIAVWAYRKPGHVSATTAIIAGLVQLAVGLIVFKGSASLSVLIDSLPYARLGTALFFGGLILFVVAGAMQLVASRAAAADLAATTQTVNSPALA